MIGVLQILFWSSFIGLAWNYLAYPFLVKILSKGKQINAIVYPKSNLPKIAVVIAAYNEENVIAEKLRSILQSNYPKNKLDVFIGSDNSTDKTNAICAQFCEEQPNFEYFNFTDRAGKSGVLNNLFSKHIVKENYTAIVLTDANVIFSKDCLMHLAKHFKNEQLGVVAANIINTKVENGDIGPQEKSYIASENQLKLHEGLAFEASIGAFGACYAIRSGLIQTIPANYLMEDFFLSMNTFVHQKGSIKDPLAIAYEDLPGSMEQEFKRKRRISSGNFQNLSVYYPLLFKWNKVAFAFFSHKVLRWFGPLLLAIGYFSLLGLNLFAFALQPYLILFVIANALILLSLVDWILMRLKIHVNLLRLLRYFFLMNIALFLGLVDYIVGVKTNIWKPTQRQ